MIKRIAVLVALAVLLCGVAALADGADYEGTWACGRARIDIAAADAQSFDKRRPAGNDMLPHAFQLA